MRYMSADNGLIIRKIKSQYQVDYWVGDSYLKTEGLFDSLEAAVKFAQTLCENVTIEYGIRFINI